VRDATGTVRSEILLGLRSQGTNVTVRDLVTQAFAEWHMDLYRYALSIGLEPAGAQEIAQEAFLRLFVALDKGDAIDNRKAWLFRVAHNLALNSRARESKVGRWTPELDEILVDSAANPEQAFLEREKLQRYHRAVEGLSEQQRQCLRLRSAGFRYREIAEIAGIGTSTVSEFLKRAIERLGKARHE
jgi:RNA polymerase sigma-70 factor (ECF subfamily)